MKRTIKIYVLICLSWFTYSCEDFLELEPQTTLAPSAFLDSEIEIEQQLLGVYGHFRGLYVGEHWKFGEFRSDNTSFQYNPGDRGGASLEVIDEFVMDAGNGNISNYWNSSYTGIFRTNLVIEEIEDVDFEDLQRKTEAEAEARFFRAFYYHNLVRLFDGVPLIIDPIEGLSESEAFAEVRRSPVTDIYDRVVIPDLEFAIQNLPESFSNVDLGRVTRGAAMMLAGDVYLTLGEHQEVINVLGDIENMGYSLFNDYDSIFSPDFKNNSESIFELQFEASAGQASNFFNAWVPWNSGVDIFPNGAGSTAGRNQPTLDLINTYSDNDIRKAANIAYYIDGNDSIPYVDKYNFPYISLTAQNLNFPVYRYAEALLTLAEAYNEVSPLASKSIELVNEVRNRAGLPAIFPGNSNPDLNISTQEELREAILLERRLELAFENKRWFDLTRLDRHEIVMSAHGDQQRQEKDNLNSAAYTNIRKYLGIPEIQVELFLYQQNPGWE